MARNINQNGRAFVQFFICKNHFPTKTCRTPATAIPYALILQTFSYFQRVWMTMSEQCLRHWFSHWLDIVSTLGSKSVTSVIPIGWKAKPKSVVDEPRILRRKKCLPCKRFYQLALVATTSNALVLHYFCSPINLCPCLEQCLLL